jgi:hypothetical protein
MNERIRELAEQAGIDTTDFENCPIELYGAEQQLKKFAELIVKECATVAYNKQYKHSAAHTRGDCAEAIKKHFGVEE